MFSTKRGRQKKNTILLLDHLKITQELPRGDESVDRTVKISSFCSWLESILAYPDEIFSPEKSGECVLEILSVYELSYSMISEDSIKYSEYSAALDACFKALGACFGSDKILQNVIMADDCMEKLFRIFDTNLNYLNIVRYW